MYVDDASRVAGSAVYQHVIAVDPWSCNHCLAQMRIAEEQLAAVEANDAARQQSLKKHRSMQSLASSLAVVGDAFHHLSRRLSDLADQQVAELDTGTASY